MDVAGLETQAVHGREMADRIARVGVDDELRPRRRARGEIEQHRVVGQRRPVGQEARVRTEQRGERPPALRRRADRDALEPRLRHRRTFRRRRRARPGIFARPRSSRSAMSAGPSCGIAGIRTRPSFIAASIVTHSSGVAPSIIRSRSPRLAPMRAQAVGEPRGFPRELAEAADFDGVADHLQRGLRDRVARRELGVEPVERPVEPLRPRPDELGPGGHVAVVEREQEIARLAKGRRLGAGRQGLGRRTGA